MTASTYGGETMTFRDPAGSVMRSGNRIFRAVNESGQIPLTGFLRTSAASQLLANGQLIDTTEISIDSATNELVSLLKGSHSGPAALYEHSPVWFPSYPYEWPAEMLHAAAELTLDIAESTLQEGFGLKDATPFNVLFDRAKPVFVDLCSFEQRERRNPIWLACAQFERMFLLPLLAGRHFQVDPRDIFSANLDGIDVGRLRQWFQFPRVLHPAVFKMVLVPHLLNRIAESRVLRSHVNYSRKISSDGAAHVLKSLFKSLRANLASVRPLSRQSEWSEYDPASAEVAAKTNLVSRVFCQTKPKTVLDIGCNNGTYSRIAAKSGARVVAIDSDSNVVGRVWGMASAENLDILPLAANFARPVPGMGWRNSEYLSFDQRAQAKFDAVLMLAVIHHIVVRDRIPLNQIFEALATYTRRTLVIEYVANDDPMFRRISRGRDCLFEDHTEAGFLSAARPWFEIEERVPLASGTRCVFVMRRRRA